MPATFWLSLVAGPIEYSILYNSKSIYGVVLIQLIYSPYQPRVYMFTTLLLDCPFTPNTNILIQIPLPLYQTHIYIGQTIKSRSYFKIVYPMSRRLRSFHPAPFPYLLPFFQLTASTKRISTAHTISSHPFTHLLIAAHTDTPWALSPNQLTTRLTPTLTLNNSSQWPPHRPKSMAKGSVHLWLVTVSSTTYSRRSVWSAGFTPSWNSLVKSLPYIRWL